MPKVTLSTSLFFDGTLNNRTNVELGADKAPFLGNMGSYDNDFSNVSKLESFRLKDEPVTHFQSSYVEGRRQRVSSVVKTYHLSLLVFALALLLMTISKQVNAMEKYEWLPTESAMTGYPMELIKGDFVFADKSGIYIPDRRVIHNGWGQTGSIHIAGSPFKPIPEKMVVSWFSYTEDKFYTGTFDLPVKKIAKLFKQGLIGPASKKRVTYNKIIAGLAPEGGVSVWLATQGVVLEVATFEASEAQMPWTTVLDNEKVTRAEYIAMVFEETLSNVQQIELNEHGIRQHLWQSYTRQYSWQLEVVGVKPAQLWLETFNGESEFFGFADSDRPRQRRAVPTSIKVDWQNAAAKRYFAIIDFDEEEVFQAFEKLSQGKTDHPLVLQIEFNPTSPALDVFLRDGEFVLKLDKNSVKIHKTK